MCLPGFLVIVAFCYDVLSELCDGFSDFLPVLKVFYATLWGFLILNSNLWVLCGLDLS